MVPSAQAASTQQRESRQGETSIRCEENVWVGGKLTFRGRNFHALRSLGATGTSKLLVWDTSPSGLYSKECYVPGQQTGDTKPGYLGHTMSRVGTRFSRLHTLGYLGTKPGYLGHTMNRVGTRFSRVLLRGTRIPNLFI